MVRESYTLYWLIHRTRQLHSGLINLKCTLTNPPTAHGTNQIIHRDLYNLITTSQLICLAKGGLELPT